MHVLMAIKHRPLRMPLALLADDVTHEKLDMGTLGILNKQARIAFPISDNGTLVGHSASKAIHAVLECKNVCFTYGVRDQSERAGELAVCATLPGGQIAQHGVVCIPLTTKQ